MLSPEALNIECWKSKILLTHGFRLVLPLNQRHPKLQGRKADEIRALVRKEEEKYGWEFLFLAANIDAVETAERYGIRRDRAANYENTSDGIRDMYDCVSAVVKSKRCAMPIADNWGEKLRKARKRE